MQIPAVQSSYQAALDFLMGRIDYERAQDVPYRRREFRLDRMRRLLARIGDPQSSLPIVHLAGTKGKGSTAAMIASILGAGGYRTGLFSSPHLHRVEERLAINGQACTADEFVALLDELRPIVEAMDRETRSPGGLGTPTYFEITTAMAMLHFARCRVDAAVLEVGLGGRLDSTNVCMPLVSVITSISFDHMKQLGNTLSAIAREKAGIIKSGVPVVSGVLAEEPRRIIQQIANSRGCALSELGQQFCFQYRAPVELEHSDGLGRIDFQHSGHDLMYDYRDLALRLLGRHQAANASVALATVAELNLLGWNINETAVRRGLEQVRWPARVEVVARNPVIILDAAHNLASVQSLLDTVEESFGNRRRILVFATTQEKDCVGMLRLLETRFDEIVLTRYHNNPRGVPVAELAEVLAKITAKPVHECSDVPTAAALARSLASPDDLICATGSFFLAAEMADVLKS